LTPNLPESKSSAHNSRAHGLKETAHRTAVDNTAIPWSIFLDKNHEYSFSVFLTPSENVELSGMRYIVLVTDPDLVDVKVVTRQSTVNKKEFSVSSTVLFVIRRSLLIDH
jgi:hypothetical protein